MKLKNIIKLNLSSETFIFRFLRYFYVLIKRPCFLQKKRRFGHKNVDKVIYVIRPVTNDCVQGLMSLVIHVLGQVEYSKKNNYIPFVDFKNYKTQYSNGQDNIWEWFFTQPSQLTIKDVYESNCVILSGTTIKKKVDLSLFDSKIFFDNDIVAKWNKIFLQNFDLNSEVKNIIEFENKNIDVENCIGVYIRGTDYTQLKPYGEFMQPDINDVIEKVKMFCEKYPTANIFLVTEDKNNYLQILNKFNSKLKTVSFDSFIDNYDGKNFLSKSNVLNENTKKRGMDYLVKILLLSKCKYLISSITSGSIVAYVINGNRYEDKYIFDLGRYK